MLAPLILLAVGAIGSGYLFKDLFIGYGSSGEFWRNSILFLNPIINDHPPIWIILLTPLLIMISIPISYYLFLKDKKILTKFVRSHKQVYEFLLNKWYFDELYDLIFVKPLKRLGLIFWKNGDIKTIDRFGPDGFAKLVKFFSNKAVQFQNGYIYHYAFVMLVGFSILLTYLILI
jgi:NADH-quinone oxidoreductase subunit L